ncbi:MAG: hypothetical protein JST39_11375 [Bacteroidetes bacterium]|nr:hypothetical protein [Bacteroidota bacterium]
MRYMHHPKHAVLFFFLLMISIVQGQVKETAQDELIWSSPSANSAGSMPCGGGDIGLNVWVEKGDLLFYLSRSGTFDENNQMLKLGRVRLQLSTHPFEGADFRQVLHLQNGEVTVSGGQATVTLWVDVFRPVVHVSVSSRRPVQVRASYESWRYADHLITDTRECRANSYKVLQSFPVATYKDEIGFSGDKVSFCHRNRSDVENIFDYTVRMEGMQSVKDRMYDPIRNNTFGGLMQGKGMRPAGVDSGVYATAAFHAWSLVTPRPVRSQEIEIGLQVEQSADMDAWRKSLQALMEDAARNAKTAQAKSRAWWQAFQDRSYVVINSSDSQVQAISRNYRLFRYLLGCNAYGRWPTKFNGGLFTFDPQYVNNSYSFSPDFRLWGGGTMTAQNQRLVYYPMLKSGDFDMLQAQFDFYLRSQGNAELRSKVYWNHEGACFTEQVENFGLPDITEYSIKRPAGYDPGMEYNAWLEYLWETVFEFCQLMLETERYEGRDIGSYIPFISSCLRFYDEHYQQLARQRGIKPFDENGYYVLYPTSAAETYKMTYNSTTVIAALRVVLERMLALPDKYVDTAARRKWSTMLGHVPPIPFRQYEGHTLIAPAQSWQRIQNTETPQLYPVFPWGIYGIGRPGLDTAINTYRYDPKALQSRSYIGWKQDNIWAARLGLTGEAAALAKQKFADGPHRFPAFWGPGFDWTPDHNWGGAAMIGLQEMLMQVNDRTIYLLHAWPKEWDVHFKLHAPYNTTVEAVVRDGKVQELHVTPASRAGDVIVMGLSK